MSGTENLEPPAPLLRSVEASSAEEANLVKHLLVLWRYRFLVVAGTLLCGLAAFVWGEVTPPTYEATARLIVSAPKMGAANETAPAVNVGTFRSLVENQSLGARIVEEFGLHKPPHEITPDIFITRCVKVEGIRDTDVIVVKVRLWDKQLAARAANRLAEAATQLAQQLSGEEVVTARDIIRAQLDQSRVRLEQAETRLEAFRRTAQIDLLRKDVDALLSLRGTLLGLVVEIQAERARLSQAESLLAQRSRIETLKRSIDTDPAAMEVMRKNAGDSGSVLPLQLRSESLNQVYENLDQVIATSRTKLAGLEKQKTELIDVRKLDADQQVKLSLLYQREMELARLQTEYDLAKTVYVDVSTRYEQARLQVAGRSAELKVMDPALPPDRPVSPRVLRQTAVALVVGFMAMVMGVLLFHAVKSFDAQDLMLL
jgi:polysaccharide biosynthesis transport protein